MIIDGDDKMCAKPKTPNVVGKVGVGAVEMLRKKVHEFVDEFKNATSYEEEKKVVKKYFNVFDEIVKLYIESCVEKNDVAEYANKLIDDIVDTIYNKHIEFFRYKNDDYINCTEHAIESIEIGADVLDEFDLNQTDLFNTHVYVDINKLEDVKDCIKTIVYFECILKNYIEVY